MHVFGPITSIMGRVALDAVNGSSSAKGPLATAKRQKIGPIKVSALLLTYAASSKKL